MQYMLKTLAKIIFFSIALVAGGCDRNYDSEASDSAPINDAAHETAVVPTEWESFKRETELQIDANQAKLRELRNTASSKHTAKIGELEERNETLRRQLREFTYDNEERWVLFKNSFSQDMLELGQQIDGVYTVKGK
jgi:hypothetical protein